MAEQRYEPWGVVRWQDGMMPTDFAFTGQRAEAGIGLMDYGARYYSPLLQRFISADTIVPSPGDPQALNRYAYVGNNPLRYTDPSGHYIFEDDPGRPYLGPSGGSIYDRRTPTWRPRPTPTPQPTPTLPSGPATPRAAGTPIPTSAPQATSQVTWREKASLWLYGTEEKLSSSPVSFSLYGDPIRLGGFHFETPYADIHVSNQISGRVEVGRGSIRFDQTKITGRGDLETGGGLEAHADIKTGQMALVGKTSPWEIGPISGRGKFATFGQPAPPLNYQIGSASSAEYALTGDFLTVKIETATKVEATFYGRPTAVTAVGLLALGAAMYGGSTWVPIVGGSALKLAPQGF